MSAFVAQIERFRLSSTHDWRYATKRATNATYSTRCPNVTDAWGHGHKTERRRTPLTNFRHKLTADQNRPRLSRAANEVNDRLGEDDNSSTRSDEAPASTWQDEEQSQQEMVVKGSRTSRFPLDGQVQQRQRKRHDDQQDLAHRLLQIEGTSRGEVKESSSSSATRHSRPSVSLIVPDKDYSTTNLQHPQDLKLVLDSASDASLELDDDLPDRINASRAVPHRVHETQTMLRSTHVLPAGHALTHTVLAVKPSEKHHAIVPPRSAFFLFLGGERALEWVRRVDEKVLRIGHRSAEARKRSYDSSYVRSREADRQGGGTRQIGGQARAQAAGRGHTGEAAAVKGAAAAAGASVNATASAGNISGGSKRNSGTPQQATAQLESSHAIEGELGVAERQREWVKEKGREREKERTPVGKQRRKADAHLVGGKNPFLSGNFRPVPGEVLGEVLCEVSSVRCLRGTAYPCRRGLLTMATLQQALPQRYKAHN